MKIVPSSVEQSSGSARIVEVANEGRAAARSNVATGRTELVQMSDAARFLEGVREAARETVGVRTSEVERVRAALADGSFERGIDLDAVVNRLLGDL